MGTTSTAVKQRWNAGHYTQVKVSVPKDTAAAFKAGCLSAGVSMASEIIRFMSGQTGAGCHLKPSAHTTRQQRRKALNNVIASIQAIMDAEQNYLENIPVNLQNSSLHDAAEQTVSALDEALSILGDAY
jgi:hypothetical protein